MVGVRALPTVVLSPAEFSIRTPRGCDAKTLTDAFLATAQPLVAGNDVFAAAQQSFPDTLEAIEVLQKVRTQASGQSATVRNGAQGAIALLQSAAGIVGRFMSSFGYTAAFAVMVSMLVSFTLTPMLSARFLKPAAEGHGSKAVDPFFI